MKSWLARAIECFRGKRVAVAPGDEQHAPPPASAPLSRTPNRIRRLALSATVLAIMAIIPLIVTFANTQLKDLFGQFTDGCQFVIEQAPLGDQRILVTARAAGTMPAEITLMFETTGAAYIKEMVLDPPYKHHGGDNLTGPPLTGDRCPGGLCDTPEGELVQSMIIKISKPRPEFIYHYSVTLTDKNETKGAFAAEQMGVYAKFPRDLAGGTCHVQAKRWYNFWIWGTPLQNSLFFVGMIVVGGLLIGAAKKKEEGQ